MISIFVESVLLLHILENIKSSYFLCLHIFYFQYHHPPCITFKIKQLFLHFRFQLWLRNYLGGRIFALSLPKFILNFLHSQCRFKPLRILDVWNYYFLYWNSNFFTMCELSSSLVNSVNFFKDLPVFLSSPSSSNPLPPLFRN